MKYSYLDASTFYFQASSIVYTMVKRKVSESVKKQVAGRQRYTCATISNYTCPMNKKPFDESGYEIDHIQELRHGGSNDIANLQALCPSCHRVKTTRNSSGPIPPPAVPSPPVKRPESNNILKHIYRDVLIAGRIMRILTNKNEDPTS